jgi:hypothetical protein
MLNIFQKPVVIDCYTDNPHAFEYAKPSKATEFLPKWWKSLPKDGHANMSRCAGFIDLYRKSYVLPMWSDFDVWFNPDGSYNWQYADLRSEAQVHDQAQYTGWASKSDAAHLKLESPWYFFCKEDVYFQWTPATWAQDDVFEYLAVPGTSEYKYQNATNVNLMLSKKHEKITIPLGRPLVFITPLTERKVIFRTHLISLDELQKKKTVFPPVTLGKYFALRKIRNKREAKCPFGFGK